MNKINKTKIFELFIWTKILTDITSDEIDNAYNYCMDLKSKSEGRKVSNVGGWQSNSMEDYETYKPSHHVDG